MHSMSVKTETISVKKSRIYSEVYEREIDSVAVTTTCDKCGSTSHLCFQIAFDIGGKLVHHDYWECETCKFMRVVTKGETQYIRDQEKSLRQGECSDEKAPSTTLSCTGPTTDHDSG